MPSTPLDLFRETSISIQKILFPLTKSCHGNYTVCGLHPYTRYEIGIQVKKGGYKNMTPGHWSDIKVTDVTTPEDG